MQTISTPTTADALREYLASIDADVKTDSAVTGDGNVVHKFALADCPFSDAHADGAYVLLFKDGAPHAGCHHTSCEGKRWGDLRDALDPGWRSEPVSAGAAPAGHAEKASGRVIEAASGADLFHTPSRAPYAVLPGVPEAVPLTSERVTQWLMGAYYKAHREPPPPTALATAVEHLKAQALFDGPTREVHLRTAALDDHVYVDLGDADGHVVDVGPGGWSVVPSAPVLFRRTRTTRPLPVPAASDKAGAGVALLDRHVRMGPGDLVLIAAFLVQALRPDGPHPLLLLEGEQGTGKSLTTRLLRSLVDPSGLPIRSAPSSERDLVVAAQNSHVLAFDNLSGLSSPMSDALCRLSTGGGFATRELYTDGEEAVFSGVRPVIANGIESIAARPDLADRAVHVELRPIAAADRRPERDLLAAFEADRPAILGGLLDALAESLRAAPTVSLPGLPRMADFAVNSVAASGVFPPAFPPFMPAYEASRRGRTAEAVASNPAGPAVLALLQGRDDRAFEGTLSELFAALRPHYADGALRTFPATPQKMAAIWKRLAPVLRAEGVERAELSRAGAAGHRLFRWTWTPADGDDAGEHESPNE